ncbi:energy-coupled thiamine transporter ThiT [Clostridium intestinale]|uniref:energy-coupled thiamine transporter ThiT n=1 Tax=Clostridium intestinale TaxID=36845 RepID=UPI002DD68711|nr:energy-coupled thiamine transporter ThiT [Clostridium intestinale]WRY50280.1 energy-coupled thiamine transporter ThiT [Clostridium intestinale]
MNYLSDALTYVKDIFTEFFQSLAEIFINLPANTSEIVKHPLSLVALIGCVIILIVLIKAKKIEITTQLITRIGIALALATVLKVFRLYHFPQGGSVTLGSMVPILIIAFMYGPLVGFLTGFLYGIITLFMDPYILHPVQVLFDYPLPFLALGLAGFFKQNKLLGTSVAIFGRFLCHFISGVAFFGSFAPEGMSPIVYSLFVNGLLVGVEGIICLVIIKFLPIDRIVKATNKNYLA